MAVGEGSRVGQKSSYRLRFGNWTVLALEDVLPSMSQNSRVIIFRFSGKTQWQMFLLVLVPLGRAPTWRVHTKLHKFRWNCLPNNAAMKHRTDLNLGDVFCLSIINHIPDSLLNLLNCYDCYFRCKPPIFPLLGKNNISESYFSNFCDRSLQQHS